MKMFKECYRRDIPVLLTHIKLQSKNWLIVSIRVKVELIRNAVEGLGC
jgi:hypothetical protein